MKRIKLLAIFLFAIVALFALGACQEALEVPQNLKINMDTLQLSWSKVTNATRYVINITNINDPTAVVTKTTRMTTLNIEGILDEGDYDITVMAEAGDEFKQSEWSEPLAYHQDYVSGCAYKLINNNSEYMIESVGTARGEVVIEDTYRGKPVTAINDNAFRTSKTLTKITLGQNVKTIGKSAFFGCSSLEYIYLPDSIVSIGASAFQNCYSLKEVTIPSKLEEISPFMFAYCQKLTAIEIPANIKTIGEGAFVNCYALENLVIPDNVTAIGDKAFSRSAIKNITIGSGVETLGEEVFLSCSNLETVTFEGDSSLVSIGKYAFAYCYDTVEAAEGGITAEMGLKKITLPEGLEIIGNYCFYGSALLSEINIPSTVNDIGQAAFLNTKIYNDQVANGDGMIYVDKWLVGVTEDVTEFDYEKNESVVVNPGLRSTLTSLVAYNKTPEDNQSLKIVQRKIKADTIGIADRALRLCSALEEVYLPESLVHVGDNAFAWCTKLTKVISEGGNLVELGEDSFAFCETLNNVQFNEGLKIIGANAFQDCVSLDQNKTYPERIIPHSVEKVGTAAFKDTKIWLNAHEPTDSEGNVLYPYDTDLIIVSNWIVGYVGMYPETEEQAAAVDLGTQDVTPYDIRGISDYALYNAPSLLELKGITDVKYIGYGAFYACTGLTSIALNSSLKKIEDFAFYGCMMLTSVSIPTNVRSIGRSSFFWCQQLTSIDLSRCTQLESIGDNAFFECINLTEINFGSRSIISTIGKQAFYRCATGATADDSGLTNVVLPSTVTTLGERAFGDCYKLESIELSPLITEIAPYTFRNCTSLKSITIPGTVKTVGEYAFSKTGLQEVVFEEGVETLEKYAFYESKAIRSITFSGTITSIGKYGFKGCRELRTLILPQTITSIDAHAFYGCKGMTIYTDASKELEGWHLRWNSSYRPIFFNCTFDETNSYVVSVNLKADGYKNVKDFDSIVLPERAGYVAIGWDKAIPETIPAEGIVLTVSWVNGYSIKYNLNGGIANGTNPYAYYEGSAEIVLTTPTKSERVYDEETGNLEEVVYVFDGWYDNEGNKITSIPTGSSGDIELTAKWLHPDEVPEEPVEPENPENPEG